MSKKSLFLSLIFSLFFISSCHVISKKACCVKKKLWSQKSKACCVSKAFVAGHATLTAVKKQGVEGDVFFESAGRYKIKITANIKGLKPNQKFGFHIHEFGICKNKALMAGGHLNPWNQKHGGPQDTEKHLGDLGNLSSDAQGQALYSAVLKGRLKKFLGRSVVIHAQPDDFKSQPTGNSGDRIACGVIVATMPPAPVTRPPISEAPTPSVQNNKKKAQPAVKAVSTQAIKKEKAISTQASPQAVSLKKRSPLKPSQHKPLKKRSPLKLSQHKNRIKKRLIHQRKAKLKRLQTDQSPS